MSETLTIEVELDVPAATTLEALREELGEGVDQDLELVAEKSIERRIHELWMNRENVQKAPPQG